MFQGSFPKVNQVADQEINLTPMMNLFVALIPFLLLSAAFFRLNIINASVPTISEGPLQPGQSEKVLNVTIRIEPDGFHLSGSGDNLSNEELSSARMWLPRKGSTWDFEQLTQSLGSIKNRFPRGKTAVLIPGPTVTYETIVQTMDASRWQVTAERKPGQPTPEKKMLYPDVVVTSLVEEG